MKTLSRSLMGTALAGMLLAGSLATPAAAGDRGGKDGSHTHDDGKVNVVIYKDKRHGRDKVVTYKDLKIRDAVKLADKYCDVSWHKLEYKAKKAEKDDTKVEACEYKKNKNTKFRVVFEDNKDKKHDWRDHKKDDDKKDHDDKDKKDDEKKAGHKH